ncbi:unnamed protein product [Acanthoscelides obtectus]|uniref:Galectin n=1 Tax=Acanthoscelides obtectus TaxID=200917 RepID=A0A9P0PB56_ACAOB|nr:unnamed protein product [Acanthoscelides obtectus]CAH1991352.1 unnamed protein product [Acanthoscelides obtectus]CAK1626143.1 Galectin-8 [Acanthoscelides obtectus]CAK1626162.1 Galectin-8 [Acanthoscelides obtectus]
MPVALRRKRKYSGCCCSKRSSSASDVYQQNKNTQCQQCKDGTEPEEWKNGAIPTAFSEDLPRPLTPGCCIRLRGFVQPTCSRFSVNLRCGKDSDSDIALHVNPRLSQRYVVRNSLLGNRWGIEETTCISKPKLSRNQPFEMDILCSESMFFVSINGKHVCAFVYRVLLAKVKNIQVVGYVKVSDVEYTTLDVYPQSSPKNEFYTVPVIEEPVVSTENTLEVPLTAKLPTGLKLGQQLEIHGKVKILPSSFFINLQEGTHMWPHPPVHLHLNPRFNTTSVGKYMFVRNAWTNGDWGLEERCPGVHFSPGSEFVVVIRRGNNHFAVWIDGKLAGEFKFRADADKVNALYIQGDVTIKAVCLRTKATDACFTKKPKRFAL